MRYRRRIALLLGVEHHGHIFEAKDGRSLFTVRSDNWNEKLGVVRAEDVALLLGNCDPDGKLHNITPETSSWIIPQRAVRRMQAMEPDVKLCADADKKVSIRFKPCFCRSARAKPGVVQCSLPPRHTTTPL